MLLLLLYSGLYTMGREGIGSQWEYHKLLNSKEVQMLRVTPDDGTEFLDIIRDTLGEY